MKELILTFKDPDGVERRFKVETDRFVVGRHSGCELSIVDSRLSREHLEIECADDGFTVFDLNSSNGSTLNGHRLETPEILKDGDVLDLGNGALSVLVTIVEDEQANEPETPEAVAPKASGAAAAASGNGSEINPLLIIAPLIGIFLLVAVGVGAAILIGSSGSGTVETTENRDSGSSSDSSDDSGPTVSPGVNASPSASQTPDANPTNDLPSGSDGSSPDSSPSDSQLPTNGAVDKKTEALVYSFMRRIATNDKRPYLTTARFEEVSSRIQRYKGSNALASNIRNAASSSAEIKSIAAAKSIKPQFLATAALAKLGGSQGNVSSAASDMATVLGRLTIVLGNELADDSILVIAAYSEGTEGRDLAMRDRLAVLAKKNPTATPREIRTIWFLKENNSISAAQYDFAMNFLAIGTITQNPKEFGVNCEALILD